MTAVTTHRTISFADTSVAFASKSDARLRKMYYLFGAMNNGPLVDFGTGALKLALKLHLPVKGLIKYTIFEQFCGGETIADCEPVIRALHQYGVGTILDYSVEGEKNETGFEATALEIIATIRKAANNPAIPFSVFKITGVADTDLLGKVQSGQPPFRRRKGRLRQGESRVDAIGREAFTHKVHVFIDGEEPGFRAPSTPWPTR
jgi:proline dehydrogenase